MSLLTKSEFAALIGKKANYLSVYISRNKVILSGELIDTELDANKFFVQDRLAKMTPSEQKQIAAGELISARPVQTKKVKKSVKVHDKIVEHDKPDIDLVEMNSLTRKTKEAALQDKLLAVEIKQRQLDKELGKSLPTSITKVVISEMNRAFIQSFKEGAEGFVLELVHKHRISAVDHAKLKKELIQVINKHSKRAVDKAKRQIEKAVKEMRGEN